MRFMEHCQWNNIYIMGVQKKQRERKKEAESVFKNTMAKTSLNLGNKIYIQIQEAKGIPDKLDIKWCT